MKEIFLTQGKKALVDDGDFERVDRFLWHYRRGYAATNQCGKIVLLHRFIMGVEGAINHKNRDPLDNRKENLRVATKAQNMRNRGATTSSSTGYKGVTWDKSKKKYKAQIKVDYRNLHLGRFSDPKAAASVYNDAALEHFGEFACLNAL